jgi:hypothetical protein
VFIHTPGDEIWLSFLGFPQDIAYFKLDANNTDGITSTDLSISEKMIVLRDKENAPCKSYDLQFKESIFYDF